VRVKRRLEVKMFELFQFSSIDISVYIILFGALILYFGKVIGDTKVERYDKVGYSMEGVFFFCIYIFLPFLLVYYVKDVFSLPFWIMLFTQISILGALLWNFIANVLLRKYGLREDFKKRSTEKIEKIKEQESFLGSLIKRKESVFKATFGLSYNEWNLLIWDTIPIKVFGGKRVLFLFSFLAILSNFYSFESGVLLNLGMSLLLTFFILTMSATAYGFGDAYYPPAKIYMDDGKIIEGKILKFGDFVYILSENKKFFINKNEINYIEESLFKEKEE